MFSSTPQKAQLCFYRSISGSEPVREWLKSLDEPDRQAIGQDLMRAQWRWPVGMPLCRPMGQGLWEIRTDLPSKRIARVLLCLHEGTLIALQGFIKKTQKTPDAELAVARKRQKDLKS
jgi:phage-related protein